MANKAEQLKRLSKWWAEMASFNETELRPRREESARIWFLRQMLNLRPPADGEERYTFEFQPPEGVEDAPDLVITSVTQAERLLRTLDRFGLSFDELVGLLLSRSMGWPDKPEAAPKDKPTWSPTVLPGGQGDGDDDETS